MIVYYSLALSLVALAFLFLVVNKYRKLYLAEKRKKASISVKHGKFLEHYIPWIKKIFPHDPQRFRFIGNPIDGILFGEDRIIFMEFKTGKSRLSSSQVRIKNLVENKKVEWREIRAK